MNRWFKQLSILAHSSNVLYHLRMLIAFTGAAFIPYLLDQQLYTIPLSLGIIAAGISDIDDRFSVRLLNAFYTYIGFFITSVSIHFLFPYPILFAIGLVISCIMLILLGSLGRRYATISYGCLLISVYSMLGHSLFDAWYLQASLLVIGAMGYGLLSTLTFLLFPVREVQQQLSNSYLKLGDVLFSKSNLFDVDMTAESYRKSVVDLSLENGQLVNLFNTLRSSLLTRLKGDRGQKDTRRSLHYYFVAQDIHERANSAHIDYQKLSQTFKHSDILFRFQRILSLQAKACKDLSQSILNQVQYQHSTQFKHIFENLRVSLEKLSQDQQYDRVIVKALFGLSLNLKAIDAQFVSIASGQLTQYKHHPKLESQLLDDDLKGWQDIKVRIRQNLTPESILFRHAIRLSLTLLVAYIFVQLTGIENGYWILLTALFVVQPNFNATKRRLNLRIIGTLVGVVLGYLVLRFIPSVEGQLILLILSAVLFFELRIKQYAQATAFMTIVAMINFNLDMAGNDVAISRLIDTMIGCAFAWAGMVLIWPDWKFRNLAQQVAQALHSKCHYLSKVVEQYQRGRHQDIYYRMARRQAHNRDAALASLISTLATEPHVDMVQRNTIFEFLCLNHTLLSYIGALAAHREQLNHPDILTFLHDCLHQVQQTLLNDEQMQPHLLSELQRLRKQLDLQSEQSELSLIVLQQIYLILNLIPQLSQLKQNVLYVDDQTELSYI